jgi:hypothetical protein
MNKEQKKFLSVSLFLMMLSVCGQIFGLFHLSSTYHLFADTRKLCGINYCYDTLSNLPFLMVGFQLLLNKERNTDINMRLISIGSILVFFGSSYYHLMPNDARLLWDRLPISLVFSGVLMYSIHKNDLIKLEFIKSSNICYVIFSILSVLVWYVGSLYGKSILSPYVFIQFGGILLLAYIYKFGKNKEFNRRILQILIWYILAKIFEHYDEQVYILSNYILSGHTIKHVLAAIALWCFVSDKRS